MKTYPPPAVLGILTLALLATAPCRAEEFTRSITTVGVADHRYPAQRANIYLEIETIRPTSSEAAAASAAVHERLAKALAECGVAATDLRLTTRRSGRRTRWDDKNRENVFLGLYSSMKLHLIVRDLEALDAISMKIADFDDIEFDGMGFESDQEGAEKRAALLEAAQAAKEKAEALAAASGVRITKVLEIEEETSTDNGWIGSAASNTMRVVEPGQSLTTLRLTVTVRARYAIE